MLQQQRLKALSKSVPEFTESQKVRKKPYLVSQVAGAPSSSSLEGQKERQDIRVVVVYNPTAKERQKSAAQSSAADTSSVFDWAVKETQNSAQQSSSSRGNEGSSDKGKEEVDQQKRENESAKAAVLTAADDIDRFAETFKKEQEALLRSFCEGIGAARNASSGGLLRAAAEDVTFGIADEVWKNALLPLLADGAPSVRSCSGDDRKVLETLQLHLFAADFGKVRCWLMFRPDSVLAKGVISKKLARSTDGVVIGFLGIAADGAICGLWFPADIELLYAFVPPHAAKNDGVAFVNAVQSLDVHLFETIDINLGDHADVEPVPMRVKLVPLSPNVLEIKMGK